MTALLQDIFLSIVIPAYNEEHRISTTLDSVKNFVAKQPYRSEIIVVDDGSRDRTVEIATQKLQGISHQILRSQVNQGKGDAVRKGMLAAHGQYVVFTDADLSTPIVEVTRLLDHFSKGYDLIIGSRGLPDSNVEIRQNVLRQAMGKCFNRIAQFFSFRGVQDSQCGFKGFRRDVAQDLFRRQKLAGFSFDAEIIFLAQKSGYRLLEMPVTWRNAEQSRVHVVKDSIKMLMDLMRIRWMHRHSHPKG